MVSVTTMRSARVDFLRGAAIFSVLLLHFSLAYDLIHSPLARIFPGQWLHAAIDNGNYGVTMFFVISGYLITSNNLRRYGPLREVRLRQFYALRFSRIIPPLLLALIIIVALGLCGLPWFANSQQQQPLPASLFVVAVVSVLTFWHNVLMQWLGYFNYCLNIYWSLSVEEVFYLAFPLACVLLKRTRHIVALCLLAVVVAPIYRAAHRDDELYFMYGYLACFDAIAMGCLTALAERWMAGRAAPRWLRAIAAVGLIATYLAGIDGHEAWGFSAIAVCTAFLLLNSFAAPGNSRTPSPVRMVAWLGSHSYELYLFHIIVLAGLRNAWPILSSSAKLPAFALFLLTAVATAAITARYFADPVNVRLRARLAG